MNVEIVRLDIELVFHECEQKILPPMWEWGESVVNRINRVLAKWIAQSMIWSIERGYCD